MEYKAHTLMEKIRTTLEARDALLSSLLSCSYIDSFDMQHCSLHLSICKLF